MRWRAALVVLALAAAWLPLPRTFVEQIYATRLFPPLQAFVTNISNRTSLALFDLLIATLSGWWIVALIRDVAAGRRNGWLRTLGRIMVRTVTIGAASYLVFLIVWGLNYRRVPLEDKLRYDSGRVGSDGAITLAEASVKHVNALYDVAHRDGWAAPDVVDSALAGAFAQARQDLRLPAQTVPARPKRTMFDLYFLRAGVAGMTDPYFLETFVASDLLPFERPFVIAHEWSHLSGVGDEGAANFVGWLTCLRGNAGHQYSGWLFLYGEVFDALDRPHAQSVAAELGEGPRSDLRAIRERFEKHVNPRVSAAGWRVYDQYLKANKVEQGTRSYAEVVRLILGTEFGDEWKPQLR